MKKLSLMLASLIGIALAPSLEDLKHLGLDQTPRVPLELADTEGKSILIRGQEYSFNKTCLDYLNKLEDGESCFYFEGNFDDQRCYTAIRVDMILHNGPNFELVELQDQAGGQLARFLHTIPSFVFNKHTTEPYTYTPFSNQDPKKTYSKQNFDYVVEMARFLAKDIDPNIKVTEDVAAEGHGAILYRYDHTLQELTLTFLTLS